MTIAQNVTIKGREEFETAPPDAESVIRTALLRRLQNELGRKFILIRAPAGFGKTTLLRQFWDATDGGDDQRVWVNLAIGDSNPIRFAGALVDACRQAGVDVEAAAGGSKLDIAAPPETVLVELARLLERQPRNVLFFIDEYQNAESVEADLLLKMLVQRTSRRVRIILAARSEPSCGAAKMRLDGDLVEFTHADLAFSLAETLELFGGDGLTQPTAESLTAKTEGWPAALRLAKQWVKSGNQSSNLVMNFSGDLPEVANYLEQEVFMNLPEDTQKFLCETAILPYFDARIADEILLRDDSEYMLPRLEGMNAFILPVDPARRRYRHHPLFADYLRSRLHTDQDTAYIKDLHGRASDYFYSRGELLYALDHAIEAGDESRLSKIIKDPNCGLFWLTVDANAFTRVMRKIERHTAGSVQFRLRPTRAFYLIKKGCFSDAGDELARSKAELGDKNRQDDEATQRTSDDYDLVNAIYNIYTDREQRDGVVQELKLSLRTSEIENPMYWGVLNNALGMNLLRAGKIDDADKAFKIAVDHFSKAQSHFSIIHNLSHRGMISILKGDTPAARKFYEDAYALHERYLPNDRKLAAIVDIGRAELLYETGELEAAHDLFDTARATIVSSGDFWVELLARAFRMEARLKYAKHGLDVALGLLGQGVYLAREHEFSRLEYSLTSQKIHLAAVAGNFELADSIVKKEGQTSDDIARTRPGWREIAERKLALVRLMISRGEGDDALAALDEFDEDVQLKDLQWFRLKARTLRAIALFIAGQSQEASVLLRELLETGESLRLRSFVLEEGLQAQRLIDEAARRFSKSKRAEEFNQTILNWLVDSSKYLPPDQRLETPILTSQQELILSYLAQGLDRKAIAERAETSTHNVQYHLKKMFGLFDVTSSARLVAEARRLGLVVRADAAPAPS